MADLVGIAPATKAVALGGAAVVVTGLSLRKLTQLMVSFPDLIGVFVGGGLDPGLLLQQAPDAALAVFSLGVVGKVKPPWWQRKPALIFDDPSDDLLAAFDNAAAGQQIEALGAIYDLTFKGSERAIPFLKTLLAPGPAPESQGPFQPTPETPVSSTPASSSG